MKTLLMCIGAIVLAGLLWAGAPNEQGPAVSGCCKQKVGDNWRQIGETFESCKRLNKPDGDNVFEQSGNYWWDVSC